MYDLYFMTLPLEICNLRIQSVILPLIRTNLKGDYTQTLTRTVVLSRLSHLHQLPEGKVRTKMVKWHVQVFLTSFF